MSCGPSQVSGNVIIFITSVQHLQDAVRTVRWLLGETDTWSGLARKVYGLLSCLHAPLDQKLWGGRASLRQAQRYGLWNHTWCLNTQWAVPTSCVDGQMSAGRLCCSYHKQDGCKGRSDFELCVFLAASPTFPLYFFFHLNLFLQSHFSKFPCAISWTGFIYLTGGRFAFSKFMCLLSTRGCFNVSCLWTLTFYGLIHIFFLLCRGKCQCRKVRWWQSRVLVTRILRHGQME